jgi:DNA-directed RNA polymerase subunit B
MVDVFLNGKLVGFVNDFKEFTNSFKSARRNGTFSPSLSIRCDDKLGRIYIESSRGRALRPLIVVENGKSLLTEKHIVSIKKGELSWDDLLEKGIIEYLDASEEEDALVAFDEKDLTPDHTHLEVMPLFILGLSTATLPYANHNHSPRLNLGSKNQKQAVGLYVKNYHMRNDMDVHLLHEAQVPIVSGFAYDVSNLKEHPYGQNIVIAIMAGDGYNMEDAVVINRSSIQRGLHRTTYFRPYFAEELRYSGGFFDKVGIPEKDVKGYRLEEEYRLLDSDGMISPGCAVKESDVVVGKTSPPRFLSSADEYTLLSQTRRESSVSLKHGEKGVIDSVMISETSEGNRMIAVKIRDQRIPEIGDKFTSRHGQKGIVGLIQNGEDMPFSARGIVPDLIFSPHGIPSRMTISHLMEMIGGKVGAMNSRFIDGTPFESEGLNVLKDELRELGFKDDGTELFYDGKTGKMMRANIFVGNMYYLRLRHQVANKIHSRARGRVQLLTRQPTEGRRKEGGLRLGEMEKDTFIAHGASLLLQERFASDSVTVPICESCGAIGVIDYFSGKEYCPVCNGNKLAKIKMSYVFKLFLYELTSLGIFPKLSLGYKY